MKRYTLIFISLCTMQLIHAQDYSKYYNNIKNIIHLNKCLTDDFNNKNKNIRCLDENLNHTINKHFDSTNPIKYDSINPGRLNYFQTICEVKYSQTGEMIDFKISEYTGFDPVLIDQYKNKATETLQSLAQVIKDNYKLVSPAVDYKNQPIESIIPLVISIKIVNNKILFQYRYFPDTYNLSDYNDYINAKELKTSYNQVYEKIEKSFDKDFQPIAKKNNIKRCYAHLYFEVSENGKIENLKNIQDGDKVFENYLKEQFLKNLNEIKKNIVIAKLLDGEKTRKTYLMSFQYGFKK
ncbi:hypothetical protein [Flavobacterium sp. JAS]|uniref:hypothetical protein n=1 Tax=Flavobacterium sp. JAS TaxID=2897329 RepID=UPI001E58688D|nr:hypothetical protein [Flavobacterium sp. JAS]MCD0468608.1 hypothetical protein [Flavobacterium sp. JAS]